MVVVVVEGVIPNPVVGAITMIAIGILLNILGLGTFCRTLFGLATNALPTFFGLTVGLYVYQARTDPVGATVFGVVAGAIVLVLGQFVFTLLRVQILRVAIALTFAVPAAFAGYQAAYALSGHTMTSDLWREIFAVMSSIAVVATAWARFAVLSPAAPGMFRQRPAAS